MAGPIVERWTEFFIDRVIEKGSCDLVYDLASPMPACVMLEFLGFPTAESERYSRAAFGFSRWQTLLAQDTCRPSLAIAWPGKRSLAQPLQRWA